MQEPELALVAPDQHHPATVMHAAQPAIFPYHSSQLPPQEPPLRYASASLHPSGYVHAYGDYSKYLIAGGAPSFMPSTVNTIFANGAQATMPLQPPLMTQYWQRVFVPVPVPVGMPMPLLQPATQLGPVFMPFPTTHPTSYAMSPMRSPAGHSLPMQQFTYPQVSTYGPAPAYLSQSHQVADTVTQPSLSSASTKTATVTGDAACVKYSVLRSEGEWYGV